MCVSSKSNVWVYVAFNIAAYGAGNLFPVPKTLVEPGKPVVSDSTAFMKGTLDSATAEPKIPPGPYLATVL